MNPQENENNEEHKSINICEWWPIAIMQEESVTIATQVINFIILLILLHHPVTKLQVFFYPSIYPSISDSQKTEFPNLKTTRGKSKGWSDPGGVRRAGRNSIAPPGKPNVSWNVGFTRKGREVVGIPNILKQKNMGVHCSFKTVSFWVLLFLTVHVFSSSKPVSLHPRGNTWIASQ